MKRIAVVVHENDVPFEPREYVIALLMEEWRRNGYDVRIVAGVAKFVPADIAISHIDLTRVPDDYEELLSRFPVVVNGRLNDISKSRVSDAVIRVGDEWDGPVIVKTDLNHRGFREAELRRKAKTWRQRAVRRTGFLMRPGSGANKPGSGYPVFSRLEDVREDIFSNPRFVIERFHIEKQSEDYVGRCQYSLGSRTFSVLSKASDPIVKAATTKFEEVVESDLSVAEAARTKGLDYGKTDFVMWEGRPVIHDLNRTPTIHGFLSLETFQEQARWLAPGIEEFFERARTNNK